MSVKPLLEVNDVEELKGLVGFLYDILDDIDTEDDVCKSNDLKYREHVSVHHRKRLVRICSNGYDLFVNLNPEKGNTMWFSGCEFDKSQSEIPQSTDTDSTLHTKG